MHTLSLAPISGRRRPGLDGIAPGLVPSLLVHALLVLPLLIPLATTAKDDERPVHEVLFLAPLLPKSEPHADVDETTGPGGTRLGWTVLTTVIPKASGVPLGNMFAATPGTEHSVAQRDLNSPDSPTPVATGDEHVYQAVDVDREVVREADAAAPIYPEQLRTTGVQGAVTVEFVVDTSGRILDGSLHVIGATHPLFAAAVRDASTQMHFRPAIRSGHIVRQQVIQSFQFVLQTPGTSAATATKASRPDSIPQA